MASEQSVRYCPNIYVMDMDIENVTQELRTAYERGQMIAVLPSSRTGFDLDAAYRVEAALKRWREASGYRSVGLKVGYANKALWRILKLETLVWAHMYEDTLHYSANNSASLSIPNTRSLKIEPEIVFGLKAPLATQELDAAAALSATDWIAIGFEIIDCPFPKWEFQPSDFVASFGLHAALVVGERVSVDSEPISSVIEKLSGFKVRVFKNGQFIEEGVGRNSLRSPALCLAELGVAVQKRTPGECLRAGEIVSSGTLTAGHLTEKGDQWRVEIEGLPLPTLTLQLA